MPAVPAAARLRSSPSLGFHALVALSLALGIPAGAEAETVDQVVARNSGGCTTAGVEGLSRQLVDSHLCAFPGAVAEFTPHPNITLTSSRVHPLATAETVAAVRRAADSTPLSVTSAFRTLVEQYLLYHEGGCGLAAQPGRSNHQSGRAVDLSNYSAARSAMTGASCTQSYPSSDPVHYDCPGPDMRSASVLVFQQLWNLNHPEDVIAEDGIYGPQTGSRLGRSPAGGFGSDLCDSMPLSQWGAEYVDQTFPLASQDPVPLRPGEEAVGTIELRNIGTETWDSSTRLGTTEPRDHESALAASDWVSPSRAASVVGTVEPGDSFPFTFSLRGPATAGKHCQHFGVVQEGTTWFSDPGQLGPPDDQLQVCVMVSGDPIEPPGGDAGPAGPVADAGLAAGGDAGALPGADAGIGAGSDAGGGAEGPGRGRVEGGCAAAGPPRSTPTLVWLAVAGLAFALRRRCCG